MAIRINSTEVISNARALLNITGATGTYDNFQPGVISLGVGNAINMNNPVIQKTLTSNSTFTLSNAGVGKSVAILLDTNTTPFAPTFPAIVYWPMSITPTWAAHRYWLISLVVWSGSIVMANAAGYDFT